MKQTPRRSAGAHGLVTSGDETSQRLPELITTVVMEAAGTTVYDSRVADPADAAGQTTLGSATTLGESSRLVGVLAGVPQPQRAVAAAIGTCWLVLYAIGALLATRILALAGVGVVEFMFELLFKVLGLIS